MKLGATVTSERGKAISKTGNEYLSISIKNEKQETIANITIEDSNIRIDYERALINNIKRIPWDNLKSNENLKHDKHINGYTGEICNGLCQCNCHYV